MGAEDAGNEQPQQGSRFALLEDNVEDALENQEVRGSPLCIQSQLQPLESYLLWAGVVTTESGIETNTPMHIIPYRVFSR